ncbi:polyphosphate polymerase domain-containing protein [bacterium]|nr:polyphosphate polymerase domain-containing protein [bacterium]
MGRKSGNGSGEPHIDTRFRRHECKYLVDENLAGAIRDYMRPYVDVDPHAGANPDHAYDITSLYLDAPDLKLFWETEEGVRNRIKLRIRHYGPVQASAAFLEIKRRRDRLVLKGRARLAPDAVAFLLAGGSPDASRLPADERACYGEFVGWVDRWLAQPVVWVKYRREAYVGSYHRDVRITMDRNLVCAPATGRGGDIRAASWEPVETRKVVLEVKFDASCPDWVVQLVRSFQLQRTSYSKYGNAVRRGLPGSLLSPVDAWAMSRN